MARPSERLFFCGENLRKVYNSKPLVSKEKPCRGGRFTDFRGTDLAPFSGKRFTKKLQNETIGFLSAPYRCASLRRRLFFVSFWGRGERKLSLSLSERAENDHENDNENDNENKNKKNIIKNARARARIVENSIFLAGQRFSGFSGVVDGRFPEATERGGAARARA